MKTIERKLSRYENSISSRESRKSVAAVTFNTNKPGKPGSVHINFGPTKGGYQWEDAPDIETARRKLEAMTRDFVNPVLVIFNEESKALEDQHATWYNAGGNTLQGDEYLLNEPHGQLWSEILHRGKWVKYWVQENERKQET
jgi:hypothetical protein